MSNASFVRDLACETLNGIVKSFSNKIKGLPIKEKRRPTIQKTSLSSLASMNVLEQDQQFILSLLDRSISETGRHHIKIVCTLQKFGMKSHSTLKLPKIADPASILSTSLHIGFNIEAKDPSVLLMWSRSGLEDLVGLQGSLYTALGVHEAVNFQSALNSQPLGHIKDSEGHVY